MSQNQQNRMPYKQQADQWLEEAIRVDILFAGWKTVYE